MRRLSKGEQALEAWRWAQDCKDIPKLLFEAARTLKDKALKKGMAKAYKPALPKAIDPRVRRDELRAECEALCKAVVFTRDCGGANNRDGRCITCKKFARLQWGHFVKQNDSEWLRYDPRNTAGQCRDCNIFYEGRHFEFGMEIDKRENKPGFAAALVQEGKDYKSWQPDIGNLEGKRDDLKAMLEAK